MSNAQAQLFAALEVVQEREGAIGQMLTRGLDGEEGVDPARLTAQQCAKLRYVLITQRRADLLDGYADEDLCDQAQDSILMFNTSFSYRIFPLIDRVVKKAVRIQKKKRDHALAFDHLLALSHNILEYSHWAHDHEDSEECCKVLTKLGLAWKGVLAKTDAELGIDAEYTRPGITYLLRNVENLTVGLDEHTAWPWQ